MAIDPRLDAMPGLSRRDKELLALWLAQALADAVGAGLLVFPDSLAGFVVLGADSGSQPWRFYVNDADPANPKYGIENAATARAGDRALPAGAGPVTRGSNLLAAQSYRWRVRDADRANPRLWMQKLAAPAAGDYRFAAGASWINKGRGAGNWWLWTARDDDPASWRPRLVPFNGVVT